MRVERSIELDVPPERVYDLVMDPQRLEDWVTIHAGLKDAPSGELRKGSELVQSLKLAGRRFDVHWEVVQAEKPKRVVWEGKGPVHSRAKVVYDLDPDGDGKTCFSYTNEYSMPGGPLGRIAAGALKHTAERESERTLQQLKRIIEG
ncbi:MAG TPA: SRPBCC family protein [Thermoleophilaceae bacterium]|jgi:carbon monoxide dehydrogenase subunit G